MLNDNMKKYTQSEFDAMPRGENFIKYCPTGDYTEVRRFDKDCKFERGCIFSDRCFFDKGCRFSDGCKFGSYNQFGAFAVFGDVCQFGNYCDFGSVSKFGITCSFGKSCDFGSENRFWDGCVFGDKCNLGFLCRFGCRCEFGNNCNFEGGMITNGEYIAIDQFTINKYHIYFFRGDEGYFVRCGRYFGTTEKFIGYISNHYSGIVISECLTAVEFAKQLLKNR